MVHRGWKIIPRPLLETVLNNHVQHHRVRQPLILHGPRGVGKTTLILDRLINEWNKGPHLTGYVDLAQSIEDHHPSSGNSFPWSSWSNCQIPNILALKNQLEECLERMAENGVKIGAISSQQIYTALHKWHGLNTALRRILKSKSSSPAVPDKASTSMLWNRVVFALSVRSNAKEIDAVLQLEDNERNLSLEEVSYFREGIVALRLAKEVIKMQQGWRTKAIAHLNSTGGYSRSLANSATDWPCLLLELLSQAAEIDYFQPKLVINNIDVLRDAIVTGESTIRASLYHDSLIWRIIALGVNETCLPVIFVTSDSYYSYRAYMDFGFPDIFISREGWHGW